MTRPKLFKQEEEKVVILNVVQLWVMLQTHYFIDFSSANAVPAMMMIIINPIIC